MMTDDIRTINEQKIRESFSKNMELHLVKTNGEWRNGTILEVSADFFLFEDFVNGKEAIFFSELVKVKPYMEDEA